MFANVLKRMTKLWLEINLNISNEAKQNKVVENYPELEFERLKG